MLGNSVCWGVSQGVVRMQTVKSEIGTVLGTFSQGVGKVLYQISKMFNTCVSPVLVSVWNIEGVHNATIFDPFSQSCSKVLTPILRYYLYLPCYHGRKISKQLKSARYRYPSLAQ